MDDNVDPLIDDVARAMTSAPADAELADRVAARIAGAHRPRTRGMPWLLVPIAAAAVLTIAVFVARQTRLDVAPQQNAMNDVAIASTAAPADAVDRGRGPERAALHDTPRAAAARRRVTPIINTPPPAVDPIEINAVDVHPLVEMDDIPIGTIAIAPIDIAPMP